MNDVSVSKNVAQPRIELFDLARGIALLAMASYHFSWDLEFFGYLGPGITSHGPLKLYARAIASTFLLLVGVSLVLAHGSGIRWAPFRRRLAQIVASALLITIATYFFSPESFVFFGILHQIALASLLGLLFLNAPAFLTAVVAAAAVAAPHYLRSAHFDAPAFWWLGLSSADPRSNDYVPLFPWFGAVLAGIALIRTLRTLGWTERLARVTMPGRGGRGLRFLGRHALVFYLVHQPVLIGLVFLFAQIHPAPALTPHETMAKVCVAGCVDGHDAAFCERYCTCMIGALETAGIFDEVFEGRRGAGGDPEIEGMARACTAESE